MVYRQSNLMKIMDCTPAGSLNPNEVLELALEEARAVKYQIRV